MTADGVVETFRRWLYLPDPVPLLGTLGTVAANRTADDDPSWLVLVGPPSSGKTEILRATAALDEAHEASVLTPASLLSGTQKRDVASDANGGLLRQVGVFGTLVMRDFGSVLSMHGETRLEVLAALREIYDGAWTRHVGADGGRKLEWRGKLGFVAGATQAIDQHHLVLAQLGERWLTIRLRANEADVAAYAERALRNRGREGAMRRDLANAVHDLLGAVTITTPAPLTDAAAERLIALSTLTVRCRSAVDRDPRSREIEFAPDSELPSRLVGQLARLDHGLRVIGCGERDVSRVVAAAALDSIPETRRRVLRLLLASGTELDTSTLATTASLPSTTTRRALEDLEAHAVIDRRRQGQGKADLWRVSDWTRSTHRVAVPDAAERRL